MMSLSQEVDALERGLDELDKMQFGYAWEKAQISVYERIFRISRQLIAAQRELEAMKAEMRSGK